MSQQGPGSIPNFGDCAHALTQAGATHVSAQDRLADGSTDSQEGTQQAQRPKRGSQNSANGSRVVRCNDPRPIWQHSKQKWTTGQAACHSFLFEYFASRHPVQAALRLASLGLDRNPSRRCESILIQGMAGFDLAQTVLNFPLDNDQPSHGSAW